MSVIKIKTKSAAFSSFDPWGVASVHLTWQPVKPWSNHSFNKKNQPINAFVCIIRTRDHLLFLFFFLSQHVRDVKKNISEDYKINKPLPAASISEDKARGWEIVRKIYIYTLSAKDITIRCCKPERSLYWHHSKNFIETGLYKTSLFLLLSFLF